jgi:hypothetical protein
MYWLLNKKMVLFPEMEVVDMVFISERTEVNSKD